MEKVKNTSFKPIKGRILVKPEPVEEVTKSGIIIPDTARGKQENAGSRNPFRLLSSRLLIGTTPASFYS